MKHMRAVVTVTTRRPKRRPIVRRRSTRPAELTHASSIVERPTERLGGPGKSAKLCPMQLGHAQAQRQLLSRCSLRWYSVGTLPANNSPGAAAVSATPVPPRLKRPLASSFGGINIRTLTTYLSDPTRISIFI